MPDFSKGYQAKITPDQEAEMEPFNATIEYFHPDASPPGEQPAPPPVIIIPPVPSPIPEPPPQPEIAESAQAILVLANGNWSWVIIPPPAFVKPPNVGIPKGDR